MNKLIDKIKYNILYERIQYPLLHIVKEKDYEFFKTKDIIFKQRDIFSIEKLELNNQKYNTIILEDINFLPLEILRVLSNTGVIFSFVDNNEIISNELSKFFRFIKSMTFNLNLEFIPEMSKEITQISTSSENAIKLLIASNHESPQIEHTISISIDYLTTYINRFFIDNNKFLEEKHKLSSIEKKLNEYINKEKILVQKQELIKSAIKDLLIESDSNNYFLKKNKQILTDYKVYNKFLVNNSNTNYEKNYEKNYLSEIDVLEKLINLNVSFINNNISINKKYLKEKSEEPRNLFKISLKTSKKELLKTENLLLENNDLIEDNNLHVSEISNLKFDIKEVLEAKDDLVITIKQLEKQLETLESQKDNYYNKILDEFKKTTDNKMLSLKENNEKYESNIKDFKLTIKKLEDNNQNDLLSINQKSKIEIEKLELIIKKFKEKNNKNLLIIDEKSVFTQKLNRKIDNLEQDLDLKDELVNKKNLIIRENKNTINLLNDEVKDKNLSQEILKKELIESNKKINSNYYKKLYENLEKEHKKIKRKYKELMNTNQEYKSEIEEYELKIQELIGYNERITKEIDIDIDDL